MQCFDFAVVQCEFALHSAGRHKVGPYISLFTFQRSFNGHNMRLMLHGGDELLHQVLSPQAQG